MSNFLVGRNLADPSYDVFSGTGAQTGFTLTTQSSTAAATVTISGVTQRPGTDFTISGTTLTFTTAPASGTNNILVQYNKAYVVGTPGDATVTTAKLDDDAVTLAKMAAGTAGNLITYDASGDPAAVATGTATHVLTSNGVGSVPTFQAVAGGGMTTLSDQTVSSATSVTFSSLIDGSTYHKHELWITDITGVTSDWELDFQYESGGSFQTSSYIYQWSRMYNSAANYTGSSSASAMRLCRIRGNGASVRLRLDDANDASYKSVTCFSNWNDSPNIYSGYATGSWLGGTGAITGIRATITAGSFSARCRLIGYK